MDVTRRIALVVEDDPRLQKAISKGLGRIEFNVLLASHFDAAVEHLEVRRPDIVCVDVGLPSKSGYELCEHIRASARLAGLPIIVTSEHGSPSAIAQAEDAGGNVFLRKPFPMRELVRCVESLLVGEALDCRGRAVLEPRPSERRRTWGNESRMPAEGLRSPSRTGGAIATRSSSM
jgi:two-component system, OmpR family, response regulator